MGMQLKDVQHRAETGFVVDHPSKKLDQPWRARSACDPFLCPLREFLNDPLSKLFSNYN